MKISVPFLRTAYNYDRNGAGDESGLDCSVEPSMTKQSFAEECDINTIVRRFGVTGELPQGVRAPTYGDFTSIIDFHTAMGAIRSAEESFMAMEAHVRARFHNDPQEFLAFCADASNAAEARKMGLLVPEAVDLAGGLGVAEPLPKTAPEAPKGA